MELQFFNDMGFGVMTPTYQGVQAEVSGALHLLHSEKEPLSHDVDN